jgi:threonine dehydratase
MCSKYVDEIVTVTDDEISAAILALIEKQKLIAEGAGATAVAAVMFDKLPVAGKNVVCLVSGGNIDVTILNRVITRGMMVGGRMCMLTLDLDDKPGQLSAVCEIIARLGGNVISVTHERTKATNHINSCALHVELETRNEEHISIIKQGLEQAGFSVIHGY